MIGKAWDGNTGGFDREIHRDNTHMEILPSSSMALNARLRHVNSLSIFQVTCAAYIYNVYHK